ncbi:MAG TPA: OsmC family protein [Kofleriaceae bacterium]|nr:OsmC family protein [Kofleriaceae bacterium]
MTQTAPLPHRYTVSFTGGQLLAPPRAAIAAVPPTEIGGTDPVWSPEELLVAAALESLWTTVEAYAHRDALTMRDWSGRGVATLDRGPSGPTFTSIVLTVDFSVAKGDEVRARRVLASAERHCPISNALRVPVVLEIKMHTHVPAAS